MYGQINASSRDLIFFKFIYYFIVLWKLIEREIQFVLSLSGWFSGHWGHE